MTTYLKNMKNETWKKIRSILTTPIPGNIWAPLLTGALLGTTMVLFTRLPLAPRTVPTSAESISGKNESLELIIILPDGEELQLRATGRTTTEVLMNLRQMLNSLGGSLLLEKSYPYTQHQDVLTMKRPVSSFFMMS